MLGDNWVFDLRSRSWTEAQSGLSGEPAARGWSDADVVQNSTMEGIVLHGGLSVFNERLGDV